MRQKHNGSSVAVKLHPNYENNIKKKNPIELDNISTIFNSLIKKKNSILN